MTLESKLDQIMEKIGALQFAVESTKQRPFAVTRKEAATLVGVSYTTLKPVLDAGQIPMVLVGSTERVLVSGLVDWLEAQQVTP